MQDYLKEDKRRQCRRADLGATRSRQKWGSCGESKQAGELKKKKNLVLVKRATRRRATNGSEDPDASGRNRFCRSNGSAQKREKRRQVDNTQRQDGRREDGRGVGREPGERKSNRKEEGEVRRARPGPSNYFSSDLMNTLPCLPHTARADNLALI